MVILLAIMGYVACVNSGNGQYATFTFFLTYVVARVQVEAMKKYDIYIEMFVAVLSILYLLSHR